MITVVGIGEDGLEGLAPAARKVVEDADVLVGGDRHISKIPDEGQERLDWTDGFEAAFDAIEKFEGKRVVILASGDPLHFGVGANVVRRFGADAVTIIPAPGAFSLAAARMGWPLAAVDCLTVHGRALTAVNRHLVPGKRLLVLSWDGGTPAKLAALLVERGFGESNITVLANMGGDETRADTAAQNAAWEVQKASERAARGEAGVLDGVAMGLPALTRALKLQKRAARVGFDWKSIVPVVGKVREELAEVEAEIENGDEERLLDEIGDLLFCCVNLARKLGIDPETALRQGNAKFERRFRLMEKLLAADGKKVGDLPVDEVLEVYWTRAKREE